MPAHPLDGWNSRRRAWIARYLLGVYTANLAWAAEQARDRPASSCSSSPSHCAICRAFSSIARKKLTPSWLKSARLISKSSWIFSIARWKKAISPSGFANTSPIPKQTRVGHFQIAGVPERHEPDTGEVNYGYLFDLIDELGYEGWIGCEYIPAAGTSEGLGWFKKQKTAAS